MTTQAATNPGAVATMRAIRMHEYGDVSVLRYEAAPRPTAGPGQLLVRVEAAGVGFPDVETRRGGNKESRVTKVYRPVTFPHIPGLEVTGIVEAVGPDVTGWKPGDAMMGRSGGEGAYAEYAAVPAELAMRRPEALSPAEAAAIPINYLTAYHSLYGAGRLRGGETVLVSAAAGGVGSAAVQLALAAGCRVFGTTGSAAKTDRLAPLGLERVIVRSAEDFAAVARDLTGGKGVDLVLDTLGGDTLLQSLKAVRPFGIVVLAGYTSGSLPEISAQQLLYGGIAVAGMNLSHANGTPEMAASVEHIVSLAAAGRLRPLVDRTLPMADAPEAHRLVEEGRNVGKVALLP